jgi:hypothetical protein
MLVPPRGTAGEDYDLDLDSSGFFMALPATALRLHCLFVAIHTTRLSAAVVVAY